MSGKVSLWPPEREPEVRAASQGRQRREAAKILGVTLASYDHARRVYGIDGKPGSPAPSPTPPPAPAGAVDVPGVFAPAGEVEVTIATDTLFAGIGDLHAPEHHQPTWHAFLKWCRDMKPGVIYASELFEWASLSQHNGGEWGSRWKADVETAKRVLCQLRSCNPDARILLGEANHDTRLERLIQDRIPALDGITSVPQAVSLADFGIEWVPQRVFTRIGKAKLFHGHQLEGRPEAVVKGHGACLPKHHCAKALSMFGEPGWTLVYWHTHKGQQHEEPHDMGVKRAINVPCLRILVPRWLGPRYAGWRHGFLGGYAMSSGATNLYTVDAENGAFTWEGRRYSGA